MTLRVLDLFCGLGGWAWAFRERGHYVVGVDIIPPCDIRADVARLPITGGPWDLIVASPPCDEFSRESMPWCRTGKAPSMDLVNATRQVVKGLSPRWWVMENVRGAVKYLGTPTMRAGSRYLWGRFPLLMIPHGPDLFGKEKLGPQVLNRRRLRAMIPRRLSMALCLACEGAG